MDIQGKGIFSIPNIVTLFRIFITLNVIFFIYFGLNKLVLLIGATVIFLDIIDGFLARKLNQITRIGEVLDQFADATAFIVILLVANYLNVLPLYFTGLYLIREFWITHLRRFAALEQINITSNNLGKKATTLFGVGLWLTVAAGLQVFPDSLLPWCMYVGLLMSYFGLLLKYLAVFFYTKQFYQTINKA